MYEGQAEKRRVLKVNLAKCTQEQRVKFARMYGPQIYSKDDFIHNIDALAKFNLDEVVDAMPLRKLNWAIHQVLTTVEENESV